MRRLPPPNLSASEVYLACVSGTNNLELTQLYTDAHDEICAIATLYRQRATENRTFQFTPCARGNDDQISSGNLTKGSLKKLYEKGMVASQQGRAYYDSIIIMAHLGKCPYCQFGHAETLDHFLPKARYPYLSITPDNLVPACMRCNKGKGSTPASEENQTSHPYFEDPRIELDIWLRAEIIQTSPVTARFIVVCPSTWPADLCLRVSNHFRDFDLAKRYAVEAASELVSISAHLADISTKELRAEHLNHAAAIELKLAQNGWKAALYQAASHSTWYVDTGFAENKFCQPI